MILNTAAQVFPHLLFFIGPVQALMVASPAKLECDFGVVNAFDRDPGVTEELRTIHLPSMFSLLSEMTLDEPAFHRVVASLPQFGLPTDFASTDWKPYLEYETPKGNVIRYDSTEANFQFLNRFRPDSPLSFLRRPSVCQVRLRQHHR